MRQEQTVWQIAPRQRQLAQQIAQETGLHPVAAEVLLQRGYRDSSSIRRFLHPDLSHLHDPYLLPGMSAAVQRLRRAMEQRERVLIYGDYDVDGLTATALLVRFFRDNGLEVQSYIPRRLEEGYGLNSQAIRQIAAWGVDLVITVDCGVNSAAEVDLANRLGVDLIITDHHTPDPDCYPPAIAVINPKLQGSEYPFTDLAGVGVAFKLVQALQGVASAARYLDLVALGTIADIVPLRDENRVLVTFGLQAMESGHNAGLQALIAEAAISPQAIRPGQVSFMLAPRLNAAGRLGAADEALQLLLTEDVVEAAALASQLSRYNDTRQDIEQAVTREAEEMAAALPDDQRHFIVLAKPGWHLGVVGIVASRIAERFHRPAILLGIDGERAQGSGRSVPGYSIIDSLRAQADQLLAFGGHEAAAGLTLPTRQIPALRQALNCHAASQLTPEQLVPQIRLDAELDPSEVTLQLVKDLQQLGPYGQGNPEPIFCSQRWQLGEARLVGRDASHLKLQLFGGGLPWEVMAFRQADALPAISAADWLDIAYTLHSNLWNGRESVVLHLRSWREPDPDQEVAVYDLRFARDRTADLHALLKKPSTVLIVFWPALARISWPALWQHLNLQLPDLRPGPLFLTAGEGGWTVRDGQSIAPGADLVWLDAPLGRESLQALVDTLGGKLYHQRIHLLYNRNDIERTEKLLASHGPSRQAVAVLYRGLRARQKRVKFTWAEVQEIVQKAGLTPLRDLIELHLRTLQELGLIEYNRTERDLQIRWLPRPERKLNLEASASYQSALSQLRSLTSSKEWLCGPDAANIISRYLLDLLAELPDPVQHLVSTGTDTQT
ncbi:MAG: single-stranded-DNA-specific exonuclease RecJ [Bacillota bacterium]